MAESSIQEPSKFEDYMGKCYEIHQELVHREKLEFDIDIRISYKFNPDMNYTEPKEGYIINEDNKSNPYKKVKRGKFTFKDKILTLLDYYKKEELHPTDWEKI